MWLYVPQGYSPSAPEPADSTSALEWRTKELERSVTLNETHSRSPIWSRRWKRASWTKHLFGAILPPSIAALGVERWIGSLQESPASPTASPADDVEERTTATSGPTPDESSKRSDPALSSWKKLQDSLSISTDSQGQTLEDWVTRIRSEFSARERSGVLRAVSASLLWRTPTASDGDGGVMEVREGADAKLKLRDQSANWPPKNSEWATLAAQMSAGRSRDDEHWTGNHYIRADGLKVTTCLVHQAQNWPTLTGSPEVANTNSNAKTAPKSLIEAAEHLRQQMSTWPTVTVSPGAYAYNRGDSNSLTLKLDGAARDWPTATAADADRSSQSYPRGNDTLDGAARRFPAMEETTLDPEETDELAQQLVMWPTLLQTDSEDPKRNGPNGGITVSEASRYFPTLRHSEGLRGGWDGPNKQKPIQPYAAYSHLIEMTTQHGHTCSRMCRRLNPLFAAWLMGLPNGWSTLATGVYELPYLETAWFLWWRLMLSALSEIES